MSRLIDDVVDFTRSRLGGGIPIEREPADMAELCQAPLDEIRAICPKCTISVHVEGNVRGDWDPDRVLQVVANLVSNAARHGDGTVRVSIRGLGDSVILEAHNGGLRSRPTRWITCSNRSIRGPAARRARARPPYCRSDRARASRRGQRRVQRDETHDLHRALATPRLT